MFRVIGREIGSRQRRRGSRRKSRIGRPRCPPPCVSPTRTERTLVSHLREEPLLSNLHAQCIAWESIARQPCIPKCSKDMKLPALFLRAGNTRQRVGRPKTAIG